MLAHGAQMWQLHSWRLSVGATSEVRREGGILLRSLPGGGDAMFGNKRVLLREQGMSKAAIARQLGVSRRTVYYWIQKGQLHRGGQEEPVQYGPRRSWIRTRRSSMLLAEYPKLTATRLYREVGRPARRWLRSSEALCAPSAAAGSRGAGFETAGLTRWTSRTSGCRRAHRGAGLSG